MAEITTALVKELREKTGAGMMDCKNALVEMQGEVEAAVDWLRKKGLAKADKKASRVAADGLIGVASNGLHGALAEVNSETDFVARNDKFQAMVRMVADLALQTGGNLDKLKAAKVPGTKLSLEAHLKELIATIGENMSIRRTAALAVEEGVVASYMHSTTAPGLGKIGVIVALQSKGDSGKLAALGKSLAMHIAAANPMAVTEQDLNPAEIERERAVYIEQAKATGKSAEIAAKMVEGRLRKEFFQQVVLLAQVFVVDGKETVANVLKAAEKDIGSPIVVTGFVRYALGEGIDKGKGDFAAEVAAMAKGS